jgi:hypothetical protein
MRDIPSGSEPQPLRNRSATAACHAVDMLGYKRVWGMVAAATLGLAACGGSGPVPHRTLSASAPALESSERPVAPSASASAHPGLPGHGRHAASNSAGAAVQHEAGGQGPTVKTVHFIAHLDDPGDRLTLGGVDPSCPVGWVAIRGTAHLQGQLRAIDAGAGCVSWDPVSQLNGLQSSDGPAFVLAGYVDDHPVGTLDGCGTGSFTMRLTNFKVTSFDVVAHTFHMTLTWAVSDGSGTGAFRGTSGSGTGSVEATGSPDLTVPLLTAPVVTPNWGTYEGTITCPHHS